MIKREVSRVLSGSLGWFGPVLLAWSSLFALGLIDNARGPVFPDVLREFQLSDTAGSFFFLTASLASVIHNAIFFRFLASADPKRLVGLYTLIMAAGAVLIALATDYRATLLACAILGVGFGGLGVGQNAAVQMAPAEHRQRAMGWLHAMYGVSSFAAPLLISYFAGTDPKGWRWALSLLSLPSVFVGLFVIFESLVSRRSAKKIPQVEAVVTDRVTKASPSPSKPKALPHLAWWAAAMVALLVVCEISVSSRLALLARRDWGASAEEAGAWLAAYFVAMTISRLAIGLFKFSISSRNLLFFAILAGFPFLIVGFLPLGFPREIRLMALVGFGLPIAMGYPLAMTRLAEIFGAGAQRVTSLCLIFQSAAAVVMHFTLGWGADARGLLFVLGTVSLASLLGVFVSFWRLESSLSRSSEY